MLNYDDSKIPGMCDNSIESTECNKCLIAEYPGGTKGLMNFLQETVRYPFEAVDQDISGAVMIRFIINEDGTAVAYSIVKSGHPFLDLEAWGIIDKMKKWSPARDKDGNPMKSSYTMPVRFKLG